MATAGDRYSEITGNIWSYSKRGDMTGVKAALLRKVDVDAINTAGWTPLHAAAAGGQMHVLRALLRAGASVGVRDRGGNLAAHEAARGGHVQCLEALQEAGVDLSEVRLSQTKGAAVRALVVEATRKASQSLQDNEAGKDDEAAEPVEDVEKVGYARQKTKSCGLWGPRRTPISTKIKKELLQEKRKRRGGADGGAPELPVSELEENIGAVCETAEDACVRVEGPIVSVIEASDMHPSEQEPVNPVVASYRDTVKLVKKSATASRKARRSEKNKANAICCPELETQLHDDPGDTDGGQNYCSDNARRTCAGERCAPTLVELCAGRTKVATGFTALLDDSSEAEESS